MIELRMLCLTGMLLCAAQSAMAQATGIAGLQPDRRPVGAPQITETLASDAVLNRRLQGVSKPWPGNVATIAVTGAWFVPLRHPGMTGPYDIRGHHAPVARPDPVQTAGKP